MRAGQGEATVAMMPMITVMASIAPSTMSNFFWPFWGFGSSTGMPPVSHSPHRRPPPGSYGPKGGPEVGHRGQAAALAATSSSIVRFRPANVPTTICGTIRPAMSASGRPQPPLC